MKIKTDAIFPFLILLAGVLVGAIGLITDNFPCTSAGMITVMCGMIFGLGLEILHLKERVKKLENKE